MSTESRTYSACCTLPWGKRFSPFPQGVCALKTYFHPLLTSGPFFGPPLGHAPFGSIQEIYWAIHWGWVNAGQAPHLSSGSMPNLITPIWLDFSWSRRGSESTKPKFLRSLSISSRLPVKNPRVAQRDIRFTNIENTRVSGRNRMHINPTSCSQHLEPGGNPECMLVVHPVG